MADASSSIPVKAGGVIIAGGGMLGLLYMLRDSAPAIGVVLIGIVVIGVLLVMYGKLRALKQAGKDRQMSGDVRREAGATPQSVNSAESRAKLDDMRRKFQEGLDRFRQTGKSLYTLPWYLVVGEPGSGKTEAIRRSKVEAPAGFQDPLQGAGGTVNMNWWFTNYGVLLDTAGRLMLSEVPAANNAEWDEFLNLLNRRRPNCPINGLILVIPADTLLTATSEKIEKTAGEIAYQFDKIQRTLGIRFPVFVLVTKCDKVMGFRQFFETIHSPDEQAQMLGWSNPARLDEPFNTAQIDSYMQEVRGRLVKRRLRLLADPAHTEDPANGRRLDQVDALYQFPDALQSIAPRLRRYLEPIFVAGTWTAKPLFLRGIYFTSSLQTGEAVDKAISDILGVDVKTTLGGPIKSETSYFLQDTFKEKVFKEKGLVTRASDVDKLKRRRKLVVMFVMFLAVCTLGGFTWYGQQKLSEGVNTHLSYWEAISNTEPKHLDIIAPDKSVYQGESSHLAAADSSDRITLADMYKKAPDKVALPIVVPLIFRPMAAVSTHWDDQRRDAYRATFLTHVMNPLLTKARAKMRASSSKDWDDHATAALKQLILVEARAPVDPFARDKEGAPLDPLFYYVLVDSKGSTRPPTTGPGATTGPTADTTQYDNYFKDHKIIQDAFGWTYSPTGGNAQWPGTLAGNGQEIGPIDYGVNAYIAWQKEQMGPIGDTKEAVKKVGENLARFQAAEKALIDIDRPPPVSRKVADAFTKEWMQKWDALKLTKDALDAALRAEALKGWTTGTLSQFYQQRAGDVAERSRQSIDDLLRSIPSNAPTDTNTVLGRTRGYLADARKYAETQKEQVAADDATKSLTGIEDIFLAPTKKPGERRYAVHYEILDAANLILPRPNAAAPPSSEFKPAVEVIDQQMEQAKVPVALRQRDFEKEGPIQDDCATAYYVIDLAGRVKRTALLEVCLSQPLGNVAAWQALVQKTAGPTSRPSLPLAARKLDPREAPYFPGYDPAGAVAALHSWNQLDDYLKFSQTAGAGGGGAAGATGSDKILDYASKRDEWLADQKVADKFVESYVRYWKTDVVVPLEVWSDRRWGEVYGELKTIDAAKIDADLRDMASIRRNALAQITPTNPAVALDARKGLDQLDAELTYLGGKEIDGTNQQLVSSWKSLGDKPDAARETLLDMLWDKFAKEYTRDPGGDLANATFSERYWANVCFASLRGIAEDSRATGADSWAELQKSYHRFPLGAPSKDPELTEQQLRKVQQLLRNVTGKLHHVVISPTAAATLATVALPPTPFGEQLKVLRGPDDLTVGDHLWISQSQTLIDILTAPGGLKFTVTFHGPADDLRFSFPYLRLDQGTEPGTFGNVGTKGDDVIGRNLACPGAPLKFIATVDVQNKTSFTNLYQVPGEEWSTLRLISDIATKNGGAALKKWDGKLTFRASDKDCPANLTIETDQELVLPFLQQ